MACTAKLALRVTTNQPIAPETTATIAPASERVVHEVLSEQVDEHQCA